MKNTKYKILLVLFLISLLSASILVYQDFKPTSLICTTGEGCDLVKNSEYNKIFLGIKNEYLGTIFFIGLSLITLSQLTNPKKTKEKLITLGVFVSLAFAIYSLYLQEFIIKAYCKYCTAMDISIIISVIVLLYFEKGKVFSVFKK